MRTETLKGITAVNVRDMLTKFMFQNEKKIKFGEKMLTVEDVIKMYDPNQHDVHNKRKRKDKQIMVPAPGEEAGSTRMIPETVKTNRSSCNDQKLIVSRAVAFLTGNQLDFISDPADDKEKALVAAHKRVNEINKMDFKNTQIGTLMKSETHCAILWYIVDNSQNPNADNDFEGIAIDTHGLTLKCKILAKSLGDDLYASWDSTGDMNGFLRVFTEITDDNDKIKRYELYLADRIIFYGEKSDSSVVDYKSVTNAIGKIPVIYFTQPAPEWLDVQPNISRKETMISNVGNTNDRYAEPIMVVSGEIEGFSKAGEQGKLLEVGKDATVTLLEATNSVESVKFEKETQDSIIFEGTQTPNISFESMKGLGTFSGIALKMLFFDASLKVKNQLPTYGESQQRSVNFIKAALSTFDTSFKVASRMVIRPKIEAYMPQNVEEAINNLILATGSSEAIMSRETAVKLNPLVDKPESELILMKVDDLKKQGPLLAAA